MTTGTKTVVAGIEIDNDELERETRQGFAVRDRMKGRGLRKDSITLYTDEELAPKLGEAQDVFTQGGGFAGRAREGVIGEIDTLEYEKQELIEKMRGKTIQAAGLVFLAAHPEPGAEFDPDAVEHPEYETPEIDAKIAELVVKRDALMTELEKTALVFSLKAVPPVIYRDMRRRAKKSRKLRETNASNKEADGYDAEWAEFDEEDKAEWFANAHTAHLLTQMVQSVRDNTDGSVNTETSFEDAMDYIDYLPPSQFSRLDFVLGKLQIKDAISRSIESQVDFS